MKFLQGVNRSMLLALVLPGLVGAGSGSPRVVKRVGGEIGHGECAELWKRGREICFERPTCIDGWKRWHAPEELVAAFCSVGTEVFVFPYPLAVYLREHGERFGLVMSSWEIPVEGVAAKEVDHMVRCKLGGRLNSQALEKLIGEAWSCFYPSGEPASRCVVTFQLPGTQKDSSKRIVYHYFIRSGPFGSELQKACCRLDLNENPIFLFARLFYTLIDTLENPEVDAFGEGLALDEATFDGLARERLGGRTQAAREALALWQLYWKSRITRSSRHRPR